MKKHLFFNIIFAISFCNISGATNKAHLNYIVNNIKLYQDTNKYLHDNIIAHKDRFQHKELNTLLAELNLAVKSYVVIRGAKPGAPYRCLILYFEDAAITTNKIYKLVNIPSLTIYFENEIPGGKALGLYSKTFGVWGEEEKDFYGKMIVKDIAGLKSDK